MSDVLSASIDVEINGVLAITQYRLDYTNSGSTPVEAIYHFTLPRMASLMDCEVAINGRHYVAKINVSDQAVKAYEEAMQNNKRAVLIESLNDGLYAINVGNLGADETIVITLRIAQLLQAEAGGSALTYRLPTTIAPRYGGTNNPIEPEYDTLAHYPFTARVKATDLDVISSSHSTYVDDGATCFRGALDRDVFVTFKTTLVDQWYTGKYRGNAYAVGYSNPAQTMPLAVPSNLHVVVDRSGSMTGASIELSKTGLNNLLQGIKNRIKVNLTGFGSQQDTLFPAPVLFEGVNQRKLRQYIGCMAADMGGTELTRALLSALGTLPTSGEVNHLVLVTDGQVHVSEEDYAAISLLCHRTGTLIHTIGVGYNVNEQLVFRLANDNYGLCHVVNPNGELTETMSALANLVDKAPLIASSSMEGASWTSLPKKDYAGFPQPMFAELAESHELKGIELSGDWAKAVAHLCAIRQMWELDDVASRQLAESLGILTKHTAFVMVDTEGEAVEGDMQTRVLAQMLPAGFVDNVMFCKVSSVDSENSSEGSSFRLQESQVAQYDPQREPDLEYLDIPAFLRPQADEPALFESAERRLLNELEKVLWRSGRWTSLYVRQAGISEHVLGQLELLVQKHGVPLVSLMLVYLDVYCTNMLEEVSPRGRKRMSKARGGLAGEVVAATEAIVEALAEESSV